jgi:hypothetical protein
MISWRSVTLVKFQVRWMNKRYKKKQVYRYMRYSMDFPTRLHEKIKPHLSKDFEIDFTSKETTEKGNHQHNPHKKQIH